MVEYPSPLTGNQQQQIQQLWDYLYKLAERINVTEQEANTK